MRTHTLASILFFLFLTASHNTSAQGYINNNPLKPCKDSTDLIYQKWHISSLFGSNLFFGDVASSSNIWGGNVGGKFSWLYQFNIGRDISQNFGTRLDLSMGKIYSSKNNNWFDADIRNLNIDFTINMSNIISPYKYDKKWNTTVFIGGGILGYRSILYDNDDKVINSVGYNADGSKDNLLYTPQLHLGIIQSYRISQKLDINIEFSTSKLVIDNLDAKIAGSANDLYAKIGIGITYFIGKTNKSFRYNSEPCFMQISINKQEVLEKQMDSIAKTYLEHTVSNPCDTSTVDSDGDSVPDCRDLEPNTPKGRIVNYQGRSINNSDTNNTKTIISIYFSPVFFEYNKSIVDPSEQKTISALAVYMRQNNNVRVLLTGHTGKIGSEEFNKTLSADRCKAIKKILINDYGITKERIEIKAAGKSDILFENKSNGNRRVDFTIYK